MRNGKNPTRVQKQIIRSGGHVPDNWLVVKDTPEYLEVISRIELKKIGNRRLRTRKILK